jgi:hypothetical protein
MIVRKHLSQAELRKQLSLAWLRPPHQEGCAIRCRARDDDQSCQVVQVQGLGRGQTRGAKRAKVALAPKMGVILHPMWIDAADFRFSASPLEPQGRPM